MGKNRGFRKVILWFIKIISIKKEVFYNYGEIIKLAFFFILNYWK